MVRLQAFSLSVVGIPVGMLLGTLASFVAVPYAMRMFGSGDDPMPLTMQFHPLIYVGTILLPFSPLQSAAANHPGSPVVSPR